MSCLTVTSASAMARSVAARSPHSQCQMWLSFLSFLSVRSTGAPGSSACLGSTTTGNGSYSASTTAAPTAAASRVVVSAPASCYVLYSTIDIVDAFCTPDCGDGIMTWYSGI